MYAVTQITSDPLQQQALILPDGSSIQIEMYFRQQQQGWFFNSLVYSAGFTINGLRICNSPNLLYQFQNQIPFGLACISVAQREPSLLQDFSSGNSQIFILTPEEVQEYADFLSGG